MPQKNASSRRVRGRPRHSDSVPVADNLVAAADRLLRESSYIDLSERQIADAAGVDVAMIRYYFGSKEGLLVELLSREVEASSQRLQVLDTMDIHVPGVTRRIFALLAELYYSKPWVMGVMIAENTRKTSRIRSRFISRFGTNVYGGPLQRVIERLKAAGIYRATVDAEMTALSMRAILSAPLMLAALSGDSEASMQRFRADSWLDHVAHLFEAELTAG